MRKFQNDISYTFKVMWLWKFQKNAASYVVSEPSIGGALCDATFSPLLMKVIKSYQIGQIKFRQIQFKSAKLDLRSIVAI